MNRDFKRVIVSARLSSLDRFKEYVWSPQSKVGFVHLAAHGSKTGINLIEGGRSWKQVAGVLKTIAPKLSTSKQRVLTLSCCFSEYGFLKMKDNLKGHFTGCYYFSEDELSFATALTTWSMFYEQKTINRPQKKIIEKINSFFEDDVLKFGSIS